MNPVDAEMWLDRTRIVLGEEAMARLARSRVSVFGLGAVGSYAVEGLARSGVGFFRLIDFDVVHPSNINRQLYALHSTVGRLKAAVAAERVRDINPRAAVESRNVFAHTESLPDLLSDKPDLVIDAIDSLAPKVALLAAAAEMGLPVFSALGAATRMDAGRVQFGRLFDAAGCPLGRHVKKRLRRRGIRGGDLWCVFSDEPGNGAAIRQAANPDAFRRGRERPILGSMATLTGMFGLRLAHEAVLRLGGSAGSA